MNQEQSQDHGSEVFVFIERVTPIEGRADDVLALTRESNKILQGQPGLIQTLLTRPEKGDGAQCSVTIWKSKADFQNFMKTDAFAALLKSEEMGNIKKWMSDYEAQMLEYVDGWHG